MTKRVTIVLLLAVAVVAATMLVVSLTSARRMRHRLDQLDEFCSAQVSNLRSQVELIRTGSRQGHVTSDHVEYLMFTTGQWVYFRVCTSNETAIAYERDISKCSIDVACAIAEPGTREMTTCIPAFACATDAFEKLADAMAHSDSD